MSIIQITILRHGTPALSNWGRIPSSSMSAWIDAYNHAGVNNKTSSPSQELVDKFRAPDPVNNILHTINWLLSLAKILC